MSWLNLAAFVACTDSEGPGRRAALWVQGCDKRCSGCCNPGYLSIQERELVEAAEVVARIASAKERYDIEGVTLLGGEPLLQARGLAQVAAGCRQLGLSVIVFTGYTMEELKRLEPSGYRELLAQTDVLVDGPYQADQPETERGWVGSRNQRFHYLTQRYDASIEQAASSQPSFEVRVGLGGKAKVNGWPLAR
jgi:anaerobic ribonucleoside-triphosphate reductase activating protein